MKANKPTLPGPKARRPVEGDQAKQIKFYYYFN